MPIKNLIQAGVIAFLFGVALFSPGDVSAIGGNDASPSNKVDAVTATCQATIETASRTFIAARVQGIAACLNAYVDCDEEANSAAADNCRGDLLIAGTGACAAGVLDSGETTMGAVSQAIDTAGSAATLDQALITFTDALEADCITAAADLSDADSGLGFDPTPGTKFALSDALNRIPGGVSCQANSALRTIFPLVDQIVEGLKLFDGSCVDVSDGETLYQACTVNSDCGATSGRCGRIAAALLNDSLSGFASCSRDCVPGEFLPAGGFECVPCPPGRRSTTVNATQCEKCPVGTYNPFTAQSSCPDCPFGTAVNLEEQTECIQCDPGTYQDGTSPTVCINCQPGTFSGAATRSCSRCPAGTFSNVQAADCTPCAPGSFSSTVESAQCSLCPAGSFTAVAGSRSCTDCPAGTKSTGGSSSCDPCAPGSSSQAGEDECSECAPGSYAPVAGSPSCASCKAGTFSASAGAELCAQCPAGSFSADGASACTPCPPGTFTDSAGATTCTPCPAGSFSNESGATACTLCAKGKFAAEPGATACQSCAGNKVAAKTGATSCRKCPRGERANRKKTQCG